MPKTIKLPMNKKPLNHANVSRANPYSVLFGDEYSGKLNAILSEITLTQDKEKVHLLEKNKLNYKTKNMKMEVNDKKLYLLSHIPTERKNMYLFSNVDFADDLEFEIRLDFLQDSNAASYIKIILSEGINNYDTVRDEYCFCNEWSIKLLSNGTIYVHWKSFENDIKVKGIELSEPIYLKIELNTNLTMKYSYDHITWSVLCDLKGVSTNINEAGIYINFPINPF